MNAMLDLSGISPDYDSDVADKLGSLGLPKCFGNMILPELSNLMSIEVADYFKRRNQVAATDIATDNVKSLLPYVSDVADDLVMTKAAYADLEEYKTIRIAKYVEQAQSCASCKYTSVCYMLTQNALAYAAHSEQASK